MDGMSILQSLSEPILEDVLPNVIKYLSQEDRNSWRLASKSMYENCTRPEITEHERFIFKGCLSTDETIDGLAPRILRCRRLRRTVEFHLLELRKLPPAVWTHLGERITSLTIFDCQVNESTIKEIIVHCINLEHFRLENQLWYTAHFSTEYILDDLIDAGVVRPRLRSLYFYEFGPMRESTYRKLLRIYPCVETFGRYMVVNLAYVSFNNGGQMVHHLADFSSSHKKVKKVKLILQNNDTTMIPRMPLIVRNLPSLKDLVWKSKYPIYFTESEFVQFLETIGDLETLDLQIKSVSFNSVNGHQSWQLPSIKYNSLSNLRLRFRCNVEAERETALEILRRCRSLRYLYLRNFEIDSKILECILRDQTGLKVLRFRCADRCGASPFTGEYRIDRLQDLEILDCYTKHFDELVASLNGPKLRILSFELGSHLQDNKEKICQLLESLSETSPNLEILNFRKVDQNYPHFWPSLKRFHKLHHLLYNEGSTHVRDDFVHEEADAGPVLELFKNLPSLLYVSMPRILRVFTYDRLSKKVQSSRLDRPLQPYHFPDLYHGRLDFLKTYRILESSREYTYYGGD